MEYQNAVVPTPEQVEGFLTPAAEGSIFMVNLLKFKALAEYEDGRQTELTAEIRRLLCASQISNGYPL